MCLAPESRVVRPASPQGFARNANLCLARARERGADLFLLNSDLVFTSGWLEPMLADRRALLSPLSNAQVAHSAGALSTQPEMALSDYVGLEADSKPSATSIARDTGFQVVGSIAFSCIKIPRAVYEVVGDFDEQFGTGEARSRTTRCAPGWPASGRSVVLGSYVLHFRDESTRARPRPPKRATQRTDHTRAFQQKVGSPPSPTRSSATSGICSGRIRSWRRGSHRGSSHRSWPTSARILRSNRSSSSSATRDSPPSAACTTTTPGWRRRSRRSTTRATRSGSS